MRQHFHHRAPRTRAAWLACLAFALGGCQVELLREHPLGCRGDEQRLVRDVLYFGTRLPNGAGDVDRSHFEQFEKDVLTPAFPAGFTVSEAGGYWRGADQQQTHERTFVVTIVHADDAQFAANVRAVAQRYRAMYQQESVLRERSNVCAQF